MRTTAMLTHAAEMTLPADNGCCTTTFPHCTQQSRLTWRKVELGIKKFLAKIILSMFTIYRVFSLQLFFDNCSVFRTAEAYLYGTFRKTGFSMMVIITFAILYDKYILKVSFRCI